MKKVSHKVRAKILKYYLINAIEYLHSGRMRFIYFDEIFRTTFEFMKIDYGKEFAEVIYEAMEFHCDELKKIYLSL